MSIAFELYINMTSCHVTNLSINCDDDVKQHVAAAAAGECVMGNEHG